MADGPADFDLVALENELCRLPGVITTRFVGGGDPRPLGATLFVAGGVPHEQLRAYVAAVAAVHFDIDLDPSRMVIVDVSQMSLPAQDGRPATISSPPGVRSTPAEVPGDERNDSHQTLESAHQAVSSLLDRLKAPEEKDTVVVTDADGVDAGPSHD